MAELAGIIDLGFTRRRRKRGGSVRTLSGALLASETDGLALVSTDTAVSDYGSLCIKDTVTPANAYSGAPFTFQGGKLTHSRTSLAMEQDATGLWKYANHNLLLRSQDLDSASWGAQASAVVTDNATTAPDGTTTAAQIDLANNASSGIAQTITSPAAASVFSFWMKGAVGGEVVVLVHYNGTDGQTNSSNITLTTTWTRYTLTKTPTVTSNAWYILNANTTAKTIYAWGGEVKASPVMDDGTLTSYVPTTTAAVHLPKRYRDPSTLVNYGYWPEEARTNLCLYSQNLANAAWDVSSGAAPVSTNNSDLFGTNTACRFTWNGSGADYRYQAITVANATTYTVSFYARSADASTYTIGLRGGVGGSNSLHVVTPTRQRFTYTWTTTGTGYSLGFEFRPGVIPGVSAAGDVIIEAVQLEAGSFASSPIPTTSASVTRAADTCSIATTLFNHSATEFTTFMRLKLFNTAVDNYFWEFYNSNSHRTQVYGSSAAIMSNVAAGSQDVNTSLGALVNGATSTVAVAAKANDFSGSRNGAAIVADTTATMPTKATSLYIGSNGSGVLTTSAAISDFVTVPRRVIDAQLPTWMAT